MTDGETIPTCCGEVVLNSANGNNFYYCKGCKNEVQPKVDTEDPDLQEYRYPYGNGYWPMIQTFEYDVYYTPSTTVNTDADDT